MAALRKAYDALPEMECKGLCQDCCGPIDMSIAERSNLELRARRPVEVVGPQLTCSLLGTDGKCSQYEHRPMVCRLWGVAQPMPCPHGCEPEGGMLSEEEGFVFLARSLDLGGRPDGYASETALMIALQDPETARMLKAVARGARPVQATTSSSED